MIPLLSFTVTASRLLIGVVCIALIGCATAADSPESTIDSFLTALDSNDVDKFKHLLTSDTVSAVTSAQQSDIVKGDIVAFLFERYRVCRPYRVTSISVDGDNAYAEVEWAWPSDNALQNGRLHLIHQNSRWRVDLQRDVAAWVESIEFIDATARKMEESVPEGFLSH
jgi:hypothetical protein